MIRTIITPHKQTISFDVPEYYVGKQIEVIAFPRDEGFSKEPPAKKSATFTALSVDTRNYTFNRDEANER